MTGTAYEPAPRSTEELAAEIVRQRRELRRLRKAQLSRSSIDDGALTTTVMGVDSNGNPIRLTTGQLGVQYDGTNGAVTLVGPKPPTPAAPELTTVMGGVQVRVTGEWMQNPTLPDPVVAPMDFARFEVHVSASVDFDPAGPNAFSTLKDTISSPRGGNVFVPWTPGGTLLYARVVARSTSGKSSDPSQTAGPVASGQVGIGDLGFDIGDYAGGNTIYFTTGADPVAPAGGFTIGDLWLKQIGTSTGAAGQPAAGTPLYQTYRWNTAWVLLEAQGISAALANALTAQQTADSKVKVFVQSTTPTYTGAANTAVWIDTSTAGGNVQKTWSGTAWVIRPLGNGAISPNSLIASNVIATGTVTAALLESVLVLASTVIAGNPNGDHTRITSTGVQVMANDLVDGVPKSITTLGKRIGIANNSGQLLSLMDENGGISAQSLTTTQWPVFVGRSLPAILSDLPQGLIALGQLPQPGGAYTAEQGIFEVRFQTQADRAYRVSVGEFATYVEDAGAESISRIRYTQDGTAPTVTSPILMDWGMSPSQATRPVPVEYHKTWYANGLTGTTRLLLTVGRGAGSGRVIIPSYAPEPTLTIEDVGRQRGFAQIASSGSSSTATAAPQRYIVEYGAAWSTTYRGDGVVRTDTTDVMQGYTDYFPAGGNHGGLIGWGNLTGELAGATVEVILIYLYMNHFYSDAGGPLIIGTHNHPASPAAFSNVANQNLNPGWPKVGQRAIDVTNFASGFQDGSIKGISIGRAPDNGLVYYGRVAGVGDVHPPTIRIQYVK